LDLDAMNTVKVDAVVETDGELHLTDLPCRKWDRVNAIVQIHEARGDDVRRAAALERFIQLAQNSRFCSTAPYPSRDELHDCN
jgi:hypothetical protein